MVSITKKIMLLVVWGVLNFLGNQIYAQQPSTPKTVKNLVGKEVSIDSISVMLAYYMKAMEVPGLSMAIINDGKLVYHTVKGYADVERKKKVTSKTIFEGASLSKPLFAYFVMGLVEEGLLGLDTPLHTYLPYAAIADDERYKKITTRMVLSHTTGFPNWRTDYKDKKLFIKFEPGTSFEYSGEAYQYLTKVLIHLLHTDDAGLEIAYQKRVAKPVGLQFTKYLQDARNMKNKAAGYVDGKAITEDDDPRIFGAAFSVHSEALDFSKWIISLMSQKGLSKASFKTLFETQVVLPEDHPQRETGITDWTLGFAKATLPMGTAYGHGGNNSGYSSMFMLTPDTKWGYVIFTNANQSQLPLVFLQYLMTP